MEVLWQVACGYVIFYRGDKYGKYYLLAEAGEEPVLVFVEELIELRDVLNEEFPPESEK
jgi:hypothetical protein